MNIGVIGTNGVIGRSLVPLLRSRGFKVRCFVQNSRHLQELHKAGFAGEIADLLAPQTLLAALQGLDVVINLTSNISSCTDGDAWAHNDQAWMEGTTNLLACLTQLQRPCRLVQQSTAMLHTTDKLADENYEVSGQGVLASAVVVEAMVQAADIDWVLVRSGALYGPRTARDALWAQQIMEGQLAPPLEYRRWLSLIHIDDLTSAFAHCITAPGHQAYIAADNEPVTYKMLFSHIAGLSNVVPSPSSKRAPLPSFRVSNARLRQTGWFPAYPSFREGLSSIIKVRNTADCVSV